MYSSETPAKVNKKPRVTEDPLAPKQHVKAAKQAAGIGIQMPKEVVKKQTQTVKEKMDSLKADIRSQKIQGVPVTSNISEVIAKKKGTLKAKHTNFDKTYKENERISKIIKEAQDKNDAMTSAHAKQEADQLGNLLGSVQHELHPLHRQAIEARAQQLRDLVRNVPSVSEHLDQGLRVQQSFKDIGDNARMDDAVFQRLIRERHADSGPPSRLSVGIPAAGISISGDSESAQPSSVRARGDRRASHARQRARSVR